ncbi:hypothetical protein [Acidobacterium sp. S8]|uniref:hypothetical protein n=1 Tax=Acidobacterium sp. S8 TaxID=1641854 RepID=UPI0020B1404E|nr:hypothetical protein [Acidobacterium sp. S8]
MLKVSGNPINGLGETVPRRPSPFFWHPPDQHPWGELQIVARQSSRKCPGAGPAFLAANTYPELLPVAKVRNEAPPDQLSAEVTDFALAHEADAVGIASMDPLYVFEGYTVSEPWVIVLALAHNYERLKEVPSDESNGIGVTDVGDQYARLPGLIFSQPANNQQRCRLQGNPARQQITNCDSAIPSPDRACRDQSNRGISGARRRDQTTPH